MTNASAPQTADDYCKQANALQIAGKLDEAITCYRKAISVRPDYAEALHNLGNTLQYQGNLDEAVICFKRTLALQPNHAITHYNLGNALQQLMRMDEAIASYRQALALKPDFSLACNNLGLAYLNQGKFDEAATICRKAISLKPDFAEAHNNLGLILKNQDKLGDAIASFRKAISLKPDFTEAYINLGHELRWQGKLDLALDCYRRALSLQPGTGLKIVSALMLPPIMGTREEVLTSRARFEQNLESLIEENITLSDPLKEHGTTNFLLAYHNLNDRDIQQKIARFYEQACPALLYEAPHCSGPRPASDKLRVGFLSSYIYAHSVSACFNRIVSGLANRKEFEVFLISTHDHQDASARKMYPDFSGTHVRLPNHLAQARETLAALELDVLVYLDIGMEPLSYFLAFSRLARAQCVVGGHPVTTGIRNMDYFLSSVLAEPDDADSHYSEKLVRLPIGSYYFERPALPVTFKTRKELRLPEDGHLYTCPMRLQKLHPDFDEAITRILQLDPTGHVVLFEDRVCTSWRGLLEKRFKLTIPEQVRERVLFLPWINNYSDFVSMNKASDVVLDPFHFGIGSTAIATFSVGTPIVTKPGKFMRGRVGLQLCKLLDLPECVTANTEDYARQAVNIATNSTLRDRITARIMTNDYLLFDNSQPIEDLSNFFLGLWPR